MITGTPATITFAPGDVVLFKCGVKYKGSIKITKSGSEEKQIIFDGYQGTNFGDGSKAIIDGSEALSNWTFYEQKGSRKVFSTTLPSGKTALTLLNLYQGDQKLTLAQRLLPSDFYEIDNTSEFFTLPTNITERYITNSKVKDAVNLNTDIVSLNNLAYAKLIIHWSISVETFLTETLFKRIKILYE